MLIFLENIAVTGLLLIQAALTAWIIWLVILAVLSVRSRSVRAADGHSQKRYRFAVIIPAHDEEAMIGNAVTSIQGAAGDAGTVDIFVVADNCGDSTASMAETAGAACIVRNDPERLGKGYALQAGIKAVRNNGKAYDAFVFFDADSLAAPCFFQRMEEDLSAGHSVIQGHYGVNDPDRTWFTRLTHLGFILKNYFQYPGLNRMGLSMPLRGSGMCIRKDVLECFGWQSTSLTEDLDFSITLIEAGLNIHFDFAAETRQYLPPTPAAARVQRARWSAGESHALYNRLVRILIAAAFRMNWRKVLQALYFAAPPMSLPLLLSAGLVVIFSMGHDGWWAGSSMPFLLAVITALGFAGYFLLSLRVTGVSLHYLMAIAMIPVYATWRIWIHLLSMLPGRTHKMTWRKTERI